MTHDPITGEEIVSEMERQEFIEGEMADAWIDQQIDREAYANDK